MDEGLKKIAAPLALFLLMPAQAEECALKRIASYDMVQSDPAIIVSMLMAGKPRATALDTGSFANWVTAKFISDDKLIMHPISRMTIYGAEGRVGLYVTVPSVDIGLVHQPRTNFMVLPEKDFGDLSAGLGNNALSRFDVELDFASRKVNFFSQDHCEGRVVYWAKTFAVIPFSMKNDHIHLLMTLDGNKIDTVFDTGSTYTYINERVLIGTFGRTPESEKEITLNGYKAQTAAFDSLSIGGVTFSHPSLLIMHDKTRELAKEDVPLKEQNQPGVNLAHFPHLLLGLDAIRHLHVYIAYGEQKIYVTAADAH